MIFVWAGCLERLAVSLHFPWGRSSPLTWRNKHIHTHTFVRKLPFFLSAVGVYLHLSYWLMKQEQWGVRERQESRSRPWAASLVVPYIVAHAHTLFFFTASVMFSWCLSQTLNSQAAMAHKCTHMHTERHDTHSSADTHVVKSHTRIWNELAWLDCAGAWDGKACSMNIMFVD